MDSFSWIGTVAGTLTTISALPQAIEVIRTRKTNGISLLMYIFFVLGVIAWSFYGFFIKDNNVLIPNVITFLLASITLGYKVYNVAKGNEPFFGGVEKDAKKDETTGK